jgi:hypothetical protein
VHGNSGECWVEAANLRQRVSHDIGFVTNGIERAASGSLALANA